MGSPIIIFVMSRLVVFSLASVFIGIWPTRIHPSFLEAFSQWDGQWYLRILNHGYWYRGPSIQSPVPFFPLFPLLGRFLTYFGLSSELALFLVANISCLGFFIIFWLLIKEEFDLKTANRALLYYAISPLSFVFSSLYSESLFLFLACLVFYLLKRGRFLGASLVAALASATRLFGIILVLPIVLFAFRKKKKLMFLFNYGWISISGLVFYCFYLYFKTGDPFPFLNINMKAWHHIWVTPWVSLRLFWESIQAIDPGNPFFSIAVFDLITVLLFSFLLVYSLRRIGLVYQIYMWPIYLLSVAHPWDPSFFLPSGSISRHLFQLFPAIGLLAGIGKRSRLVHYLIIFYFTALMGPFSLAFFHGLWVE